MTNRLAICVAAAGVLAAARAMADQPATGTNHEKCYSGMVTSIDPQERVLSVKEWWFMPQKHFDLGADCTFAMAGENPGTINDLRPGERVTVNYQAADGVLIADRIAQRPMHYTGMVEAIDPNRHTLKVASKDFQLADGCAVVLRKNKSGTLAAIQPGDHVTVTYETPGNTATAREIRMTSASFTGNVTAIDLNTRTVEAKSGFEQKQFQLGDDCAIVINGKTSGTLADLRPDEQLQFNYNDINGVNVASRIAPAPAKTPSSAYLGRTGTGLGD